MKLLLIAILFFTASTNAYSRILIQSGPDRTDLVELFTSEGCSSCPPADRKINAYASHKKLWKDIVPVAFHVDYWNYLGWHDPYSSPRYTQRQQKYAKSWRARTVYTPCIVVNGKDRAIPTRKTTTDKPGILSARINGQSLTIKFQPEETARQNLTAWIAPLTGKETRSITRGENRGRTLTHNFVALDLIAQPLLKNGRGYSVQIDFPQNPKTKALAIWVTRKGSLVPVQAAGGWLKSK